MCNHQSYFEPFVMVSLGHAHVAKYQVAQLWYWRLPLAFLQVGLGCWMVLH